MKKQTLLTVFVALALVLAACGGNSDLAKNRDKWNSQGINHYRYELTVSCFCPFREIMPVTVEVLDGKTVSMIGADGQPLQVPALGTIEQAGTVEGLFAIAEDALANADHAEVTYDATYGFPASIVVDWIELAMDDEISYYVANFEVLE